jgi:uncharacterized membrane protein
MKRIQFLRSHFLAGLLVLAPLGVITWLLTIALGALWRVHFLLPEDWRPDAWSSDPLVATLLNLGVTLGISLFLLVAISVLGWSSKQYIGKKVLQWVGEWIQRIPVIRSVYSALDQFLRTLTAGGGQQFNRVVYIEYPRKGIWALAFVTGPAVGPAVPPKHLNVYIPTTPNPTSGFHLIVPEEEVRESHLKVEDAFKTILSLGIAQTESAQVKSSKTSESRED